MEPLAQTLFIWAVAVRARILARIRLASASEISAPVFIIGCGRSGTTLLGELLAAHPAVSYLYEPNDRWAAIEPTTDYLQLYSRGEHYSLLDATSATAVAQRRFRRLMSSPPGFTLIEKSPHNTLRIGYLEALVPNARFVHIVRDGVDVAYSIEKMAAATTRMAFRPPRNEWWGIGGAKWAALERDGRAAGYYPDEVSLLATDAQRGAYEWLLSLREVERWRARLGSRLVEVRYQDLADDPRRTLQAMVGSLGLPCPDRWLDQVVSQVKPIRHWHRRNLALPHQMCADFNSIQARLGFKGRAVQLASVDGPHTAGSLRLPDQIQRAIVGEA